jgi:acyl-coenzyme A thioesterase PaaI-like protein
VVPRAGAAPPAAAHTGVFDEATAARPLGDGRFAVLPDERFAIGAAVNGGVLVASVLRAVLHGSPHPYPVATSSHFLRVARPEPAEVQVTWLKRGRTAATARATFVQDGVPIIESVVTTGMLAAAGASGAAVAGARGVGRADGAAGGSGAAGALSWTGEPPHLPPLGDCLAFAAAAGFTGQIDIRFDPATMGWRDGEPDGRPEMRGYLGLRERRDPDAYLLAVAVDALPPVVFGLGAVGWAPTVELTWHMRGVPAPGLLRVAARCRHVSSGWFDEEAEVWDSAGHLVAQSRQLARVGRSQRGGPA